MPNLTPAQQQWCVLGFCLAMTAVVILADLWFIRQWGVGLSISRVLRRTFSAHPAFWAAFVFWLGILVGHFGLPSE